MLDTPTFFSGALLISFCHLFCMQCFAVWKNTVIHLLPICTWQEHLLCITCLTQVNRYPIPYCKSSYLFSIGSGGKKKTSTLTFLVLPVPLIHVQPFEISKDSRETHKTGQSSSLLIYPTLHLHCALFIVLSYCRHFPDIWGTFVLQRPQLCFDFQLKLIDHTTDFFWVLCMDYECVHHVYHFTAAVLLLETYCAQISQQNNNTIKSEYCSVCLVVLT